MSGSQRRCGRMSGRIAACMAVARQPKHDRSGRIRLGARLGIRSTGQRTGDAYRRQSAWEDPSQDLTIEAPVLCRRAATFNEV
jgi:hypothetical protein